MQKSGSNLKKINLYRYAGYFVKGEKIKVFKYIMVLKCTLNMYCMYTYI